jgi:Ala-tRNA(Pro) deacylase
MSVHMPSATFLDRLDQELVSYELLHHHRTDCALDEADAVGAPPREVAKTIVLTTPRGFVRAVLPASERLDLEKARRALGIDDVKLATEKTLAGAYPEFELGAVPPTADLHRDRVLVDARLLDSDSVVVDAGSHVWSLRLRTADLLAISDARIADLCSES